MLIWKEKNGIDCEHRIKTKKERKEDRIVGRTEMKRIWRQSNLSKLERINSYEESLVDKNERKKEKERKIFRKKISQL